MANGKPPSCLVLSELASEITNAQFSPDGKRLIIASGSPRVTFLTIPYTNASNEIQSDAIPDSILSPDDKKKVHPA